MGVGSGAGRTRALPQRGAGQRPALIIEFFHKIKIFIFTLLGVGAGGAKPPVLTPPLAFQAGRLYIKNEPGARSHPRPRASPPDVAIQVRRPSGNGKFPEGFSFIADQANE